MQDEPLNKSSVQMREKIVLPLLTIQQFALNKIHLESEFKSIYEQIVMRSLFGNINASRNSA
jgi:phosphoenolpyruvate carboxylase